MMNITELGTRTSGPEEQYTRCEPHVSRRVSAAKVSCSMLSVKTYLEPLVGSTMTGSIKISEENNSGCVRAANVL